VDAGVKAGALELIDAAGAGGWPTRWAALLPGLDLDRVRRWRVRHLVGTLTDRAVPARLCMASCPANGRPS